MAVALTWKSYVDTDLDFAEFFASSHTLSVRFMPQYPNGYQGPCIAEAGKGNFFLGQDVYSREIDDTGNFSPQVRLAVGNKALSVRVSLQAARWYHLAAVATVTRTGRTYALYLDGKSLGTLALGTGVTDLPTGTLRFGKRKVLRAPTDQRNFQFYGLIADVGVFTRALAAGEVAALATPAKGFTGSEVGLLAAYPLTAGRKAGKLSRPVTLRGPAALVKTSAGGDSAADAKRLPVPTGHQPMDLPFPPGEAWLTGQAWNGTTSHWGLAEFCWDLTLAAGAEALYPLGTDGAPFYAAAPGEIIAVRESAPSGTSEYSNHIDLLQAESEVASYIHLKQNQALVEVGQSITAGQKLGLSGDTGTNGTHLHFAVSDKADQTPGFVTIPVAFSDYEVRVTKGVWKAVPRGVPTEGQTIRNPPTPLFGPDSLDPGSAVSRAPDSLDLVATAANGGVWVARWSPGTFFHNWDRWRPVLARKPGSHTASVVSRSDSRLDVVVADGIGRVYTGGWNAHHNFGIWGGWWQIKNFGALPNAPVAIVSRSPGKLDVFAANAAGQLFTAAWDQDAAGGKWMGWWDVAGGITAPGGAITAVSRGPHKLDLFMVGLNGGVYTAAWDGQVDGKWHGWWRVEDVVAKPGSRVGAVSRDPDKLDIFVARQGDGAIVSAAWDRLVANGEWRGWWSVASGSTAVGSPVTAVSRHPNNLDLFVVGKNGGIYTAAWQQGVQNGEWRGWWRVGSYLSWPGAAVAAVARETEKLDIFATGVNGRIATAAWDHHAANGAWQGWWQIG